MATMNISLPDEMKAFVEERVDSGRFANASDYVRDLIRDDQDQRQRAAERLLKMVDDAVASGTSKMTPAELRAYALDRSDTTVGQVRGKGAKVGVESDR